MNSKPPNVLLFEDSNLTIFYRESANLNTTNSSVVIQGSRGGFLSLANAVLFYLNDLQDVVKVHALPFVTSDIHLTIESHESLKGLEYGIIERSSEKEFRWKMSESEICRVASEIHSLGYVNSELHFDKGKEPTEITVYCVLQ